MARGGGGGDRAFVVLARRHQQRVDVHKQVQGYLVRGGHGVEMPYEGAQGGGPYRLL